MYDVLIIGAGVIGSFVARELSKYDLKVIVLEKENDVGNVTSAANSGIIHSGYDPLPNTNKAKHNINGNKLYKQICSDLDVEFDVIGSLTCATNKEEIQALESLMLRSKENDVKVELLNKKQVQKLEPFISDAVEAALYAKTAGIINPFELCVALMENAVDNGVVLNLNKQVKMINKNDDFYLVETDNKTYQAKVVVNAAGLFADKMAAFVGLDNFKITPRKGEYIVLDHFLKPFVSHVIFPAPSKVSKGILITPTTSLNYLIGPTSTLIDDREDFSTEKLTMQEIKTKASKIVKDIPFHHNIRQFAGLRATSTNGDFVIQEKDGFITLGGIDSPGLASAPSIARSACEMVGKTLKLKLKKDYNPKRKHVVRIKDLSDKERIDLIKKDKNYGRIVCRCEGISEGEVIDSINRNVGARTIKGVKKRCRPGAGMCQGGFCEPLIINILAKQLSKDVMDIEYDVKGSKILKYKSKEGEDNNG